MQTIFNSKICVSIFADELKDLTEFSTLHSFCELRLDNYIIDNNLDSLFSAFEKCIATYPYFESENNKCIEIYRQIIDNKPDLIDLSLKISESTLTELIKLCNIKNIDVILSYHNYKLTPITSDLEMIVKKMKSYNTKYIKIVTNQVDIDDARRVLDLYKFVENKSNLLAFCLGERGKSSRIESLQLGAPFMYVNPAGFSLTADGQYSFNESKNLLEKLYENI